MKKSLLAISAATALFTSSAVAADYNFEFTPVIGGVMPEKNLDIDDHGLVGFRIGKNLQNSYFSQIEVGFDVAPRVKVDYTSGKKVDIYRGLIHLVKDIPLSKSFSFYGLVGAGAEALSDNWRDNNDRMFIDYGLGVKYKFTDRLALKAELTHEVKLNADEDHYTNNIGLFTLGLSYTFGETAQAPVEKVVVVEEKPVVEEVVVVAGDDDGDGVANNMDECPNTPAGVPVDAKGCPQTISLHVNFNFNKANVLPKYDAQISKVADFMVKYPVYNVMLEGYTDSTGPEAYNLKLSDKRAASVAKELKKKGVEEKKISTVGYGESNPVASNKTREGRAQNRRVDAVFSY